MAIMFKWLKALAEYILKFIRVWPCVHVCFRQAQFKGPGIIPAGLWDSEHCLDRALSLFGCRTAFRSDSSSGGFHDLTPDFMRNFISRFCLFTRVFGMQMSVSREIPHTIWITNGVESMAGRTCRASILCCPYASVRISRNL